MKEIEYVYRCPIKCPIGKHCFVIKVAERINEPLIVLHKCLAKKQDIRFVIGGLSPPL